MALNRVGSSLGRRLRALGARLRAARQARIARPRTVLAAVGAVVLGSALFCVTRGPRASAAAGGDPVSALGLARASKLPLEHAAAAIQMREFSEALDVLERARAASPELAADPTFIALSLQTFNAGRSTRSAALLVLTPRDDAIPALQAASLDWSWRTRHGAADLLKSSGVGLEDPIGFALLDLWQTEQCDQRRAAARKLLTVHGRNERLIAGLDAAAHRPADDGCLRDLFPAPSAAR